jgi:hypothetical protein
MGEGAIYQAMAAILKDFGALEKDKRNPQGWNFRSVDQAMGRLHTLMSDHGVFVCPEVVDVQRSEYTTSGGKAWQAASVTMKYTFVASDGSSVSVSMVGEGADMGDKATSKAVAMALKYAIFQTFSVPTEDPDPDSQIAEPRSARPKPRAPKASTSTEEAFGKQPQPARDEIREALKHVDLPNGWQDGKCGAVFKQVAKDVGADYSGFTWHELVHGKGKDPQPAATSGKRYAAVKAAYLFEEDHDADILFLYKCQQTAKRIQQNDEGAG